VIPAVPISSLQQMLKQMAPLLQPGSLVIDVCSVKTLPAKWMEEILPPSVSILATHPMFGPDSAARSLEGMKIALCKVKIDDEPYTKIKSYLTSLGLEVIETTTENHDRQIAVSLSLTHFIGRALAAFGAQQTDHVSCSRHQFLGHLGLAVSGRLDHGVDLVQFPVHIHLDVGGDDVSLPVPEVDAAPARGAARGRRVKVVTKISYSVRMRLDSIKQ